MAIEAAAEFMTEKKKKEKVIITGDDILIEYVRRIKRALKRAKLGLLPNSISYYLEKFIHHKVWATDESPLSPKRQLDFNNGDLFRKVKIRYVEMKHRRQSINKLEEKKDPNVSK